MSPLHARTAKADALLAHVAEGRYADLYDQVQRELDAAAIREGVNRRLQELTAYRAANPLCPDCGCVLSAHGPHGCTNPAEDDETQCCSCRRTS